MPRSAPGRSTARPSTSTRPSVGRGEAGDEPEDVDLPHPEVPTSTANSRSRTSKLIPSSAVTVSPRRVRKRLRRARVQPRGAPRAPRRRPTGRARRTYPPAGGGLRGVPRGDRGPGGPAERARANTRLELGDRDADLAHRVPVADRHAAVAGLALVGVADRLHVHRDAVRRAHLVLPAVEAADRGGVVVDAHPAAGGEPVAELPAPRHDLVPLLEERQHRDLDGRDLGVEAQHHALLAPHVLDVVGVGEDREHACGRPPPPARSRTGPRAASARRRSS